MIVAGDHPRRLRRQRHPAAQDVVRGDAAGRVGDEARLAVVGERVHQDALAVERLVAEGRVRVGDAVVEAAAAADHEGAVAADVPGEAAARGDVVDVAQVARIEAIARLEVAVGHVARPRIEGHRSGDVRRVEGAEVGVPAQAAVDGQRVVDLPGVADPQGDARPRDVDGPVAEVLVEAPHRRVEAGEIPPRRVVPGVLREPPRQVGRGRIEDELAARQQLPLPGVVPAQVFGADLEVVGADVGGEVVAQRPGVLVELLRVVAALPDGDGREHVVRRVGQRRLGQQVLPVEVAVADPHFLDRGVADHVGPGVRDVERLARAVGGLRRMLGAGHLRERVAPVPVRPPRREVIALADVPVAPAEEAVLHQLGVERPVEARQRRRRRQDGVGFVLALVGQEVVQLVADDRAAHRAADLLVGVGQHAVGDEVLAVQALVAEVAVEAAVQARWCPSATPPAPGCRASGPG